MPHAATKSQIVVVVSQNAPSKFVGIDLGGGRGKTTALCELERNGAGASVVRVIHRVAGSPLTDDALLDVVRSYDVASTVLALAAPLTMPACARCPLAICPGVVACPDPAVGVMRQYPAPRLRVLPYLHRATELEVVLSRGLLPLSWLGGTGAAIAGRAQHLRRCLGAIGFRLNENLVEVEPAATVAALFGESWGRSYKRDADPWHTRAKLLEALKDLRFAPSSRFAREEVLQNDHRFDAMLAAYTAYLRTRDAWQVPPELTALAAVDGWIWTPPRG